MNGSADIFFLPSVFYWMWDVMNRTAGDYNPRLEIKEIKCAEEVHMLHSIPCLIALCTTGTQTHNDCVYVCMWTSDQSHQCLQATGVSQFQWAILVGRVEECGRVSGFDWTVVQPLPSVVPPTGLTFVIYQLWKVKWFQFAYFISICIFHLFAVSNFDLLIFLQSSWCVVLLIRITQRPH